MDAYAETQQLQHHQKHLEMNETRSYSVDRIPPTITDGRSDGLMTIIFQTSERLRRVHQSTASIANGYISTALALFTVVTNCLVCIVLLKRHMRSSPTNVLLIFLSISTTLTGCWPIAVNVYFYVFGWYAEWASCDWARLYDIFVDYLPTICHTWSIWLTVALAAQRYIIVCHGKTAVASRWCTVAAVVRISGALFVIACLFHGFRFFENVYEVSVAPSTLKAVSFEIRDEKNYSSFLIKVSGDGDEIENASSCATRYVSIVDDNDNVYFTTYYVFRIIFINTLPCIVLVLLNAALVSTMRKAEARRKILLKYNRRSESRRLAESNSTTLMLVVVVGVFLVVEFPMAVVFATLVIDNTCGLGVFTERISNIATIVVNLLILFSYLINFFIYCSMSRQFRDTFKGLFVTRSASGASNDSNAVGSNDDFTLMTNTCGGGGGSIRSNRRKKSNSHRQIALDEINNKQPTATAVTTGGTDTTKTCPV